MAFVESSTKAGWLSLKALQNQDGFRWKLYESRMVFVERSTKAGWLSLKAQWKQDGFCWKLYKSRMTFVESSTKAGWLSFKALWKPFKKRVNCDNTKFHDKIAYVGGPSFRRRPWPFGERRLHARTTCATLPRYTWVQQKSSLFQSKQVYLPPMQNGPEQIFRPSGGVSSE